MVGSTAETAEEPCTAERADGFIITAEDVQAQAIKSIDFHLHLIYEQIVLVQLCMKNGKTLSASVLDSIDEHLMILEGHHPEQNKHIVKPPENAWSTEQRDRQREATWFIRVLRTRYRGFYQEEADTVSSLSSPDTPPPHAKSA